MYCAVHSSRYGTKSLFSALRLVSRSIVSHVPICLNFQHVFQLLGQFQLQRNHKGVTEMFTRLYKPFLWRSLKVLRPDVVSSPSSWKHLLLLPIQVANACVRANAAALLFDGFPLCEPDVGKEEADELLQRQFDIMRVCLCIHVLTSP